MEKIDAMIKEALEAEDSSIWAETEELGYFASAFGLFRGKAAWVNWVIMLAQGGLFLVAVWFAVEFFAATDVVAALKWGISGAVLMLTAFSMKMSLMIPMQTNRVIRELKRVELMLAVRAEKP
ncbi:MAG: DUF6768 family protein [Paracoccaceae bacterium]